VATCVVRLSDVAPDGTSSLVATGALNLTHRQSDADPTPMPVDRRTAEPVRIPLRTSGYRFAVDHRIRLTVLGGYWPVLWPSPFPGVMDVFRGAGTPSRLVLPVLPDDARLPAPPAFGPAIGAALREVGSSDAYEPGWRIEEDVLAGTVSVAIEDGGTSIAEDGARVYSAEHLRLTASDADPAHARLAADVVYRWTVDGADIDIRATGIIASEAEAFEVGVELDVQLRRASALRMNHDEDEAAELARRAVQDDRGAAELGDPDLERDPRPGRGLLKDHPECPAGEEMMCLAPVLLFLELVGEVEHAPQIVARPVRHAGEVAAFQALEGRNHADSMLLLQAGPTPMRASAPRSSRRRARPVNMRLLIVPSGSPRRSASSDCVYPP